MPKLSIRLSLAMDRLTSRRCTLDKSNVNFWVLIKLPLKIELKKSFSLSVFCFNWQSGVSFWNFHTCEATFIGSDRSDNHVWLVKGQMVVGRRGLQIFAQSEEQLGNIRNIESADFNRRVAAQELEVENAAQENALVTHEH